MEKVRDSNPCQNSLRNPKGKRICLCQLFNMITYSSERRITKIYTPVSLVSQMIENYLGYILCTTVEHLFGEKKLVITTWECMSLSIYY